MQYTLTVHGRAVMSAAYVKDQCWSDNLPGLVSLAKAWLETPRCGGCVIESDETATEARERLAMAARLRDSGHYWLSPGGYTAEEVAKAGGAS